jgi:hypothetical protein
VNELTGYSSPPDRAKLIASIAESATSLAAWLCVEPHEAARMLLDGTAAVEIRRAGGKVITRPGGTLSGRDALAEVEAQQGGP